MKVSPVSFARGFTDNEFRNECGVFEFIAKSTARIAAKMSERSEVIDPERLAVFHQQIDNKHSIAVKAYPVASK